MARIKVLIEVAEPRTEAFATFDGALASDVDAVRAAERALDAVAGLGVELATDLPPVPMVPPAAVEEGVLATFSSAEPSPDVTAGSVVVAADVERSRLADLRAQDGVVVWPDSELTLYDTCEACGSGAGDAGIDAAHAFDAARSDAGVDCRPYRPGVTIEHVRTLLGVGRVWRDGFRGQNVVVGIIDEGVAGDVYPVVGGFSRPSSQQPGTAAVTSHGSMCAADVLVAAPAAKLYDYPFLGRPSSGGALQMFQAALAQRRIDGTPQVLNNSYGFVNVPEQAGDPGNEIWDLQHPIHRKVREVVASGATVLYAAGNCGAECPSGSCRPSSIGPGRSIHGSNSLDEVLTVAAVNAAHQRIGYSSVGPGMFQPAKPDVAAYSHLFGNFGPGRPGGDQEQDFDNGTSAAAPVAAGVVALLLSAFPDLTPAEVRTALVSTATDLGVPGFDHLTGHGVVNAAAAYVHLLRR